MDLKFALLADHVTETREGKLVIVGEFNMIWSEQVPIRHGPFFLLARFEARVSEGVSHKIRIALVDEDGNQTLPPSPEIPINFAPTGPGYPLRGQVVVHFGSVEFPKPGDYEFHILVDGHIKAVVPLRVGRTEHMQKHVQA